MPKGQHMRAIGVMSVSVSGLLLGGTGIAFVAAALTPLFAGMLSLLRPQGSPARVLSE